MEPVSGINSSVLKWARETAGYSIADIAVIMKKPDATIELWESGDEAPTYSQLEKLAYTVYKRPLALFFFPSPPAEPDPKNSFRTLPEFEIDNFSSDTRYAIRQARAMQLALEELNNGINPSSHKIFLDLKIKIGARIEETAVRVRKYLGIELKEQISWRRSAIALKKWKDALEEKGIFIFKRSFKQKNISGFCLLDDKDIFPIIYLNNGTSETRQIFTIFHELSHILLNVNGITLRNDRYINSLSGNEKKIEVFGNQFAAEFLVPEKDFKNQLSQGKLNDLFISQLAKRYKVSREVILRKLLDRDVINKDYYEQKAKEWIADYERGKSGKKGGDYYLNQMTYLGERFVNLAFRRHYQGRCSLEQLADYFNIKAKNITNLEQIAMAG